MQRALAPLSSDAVDGMTKGLTIVRRPHFFDFHQASLHSHRIPRSCCKREDAVRHASQVSTAEALADRTCSDHRLFPARTAQTSGWPREMTP